MQALLNMYRAVLHGLPLMNDVKPAQLDAEDMRRVGTISTNRMVGHCLWMLDQMERMMAQARKDGPAMKLSQKVDLHGKLMRWLGFIQGWLWHQGVYSLDELRDQTRKVLGK